MSDSKTYNGWKNYETWLVALWLDNDQGSYEHWKERAEECYAAEVRATPEDYRRDWLNSAEVILTGEIKTDIENAADELNLSNGVFSDLLNAALSEVDFYEIAHHYLSDLDHDQIEADSRPTEDDSEDE